MKRQLMALSAILSLVAAAPSARAAGPIKHVVIIFQENRTPDNLFHDPVLIKNGADIAFSGTNSKGQVVLLTSIPLANSYDLDHSHTGFNTIYDGGKMDGADKVHYTCNANASSCPPANPAFKYVNPADVAPYFALAEQYVFADRMFQTNQGPSFPAHQFILSGTSAPTATSDLFASENVHLPTGYTSGAGCIAPPGSYVRLINPAGSESQTMYPCFEHATLPDLLNARGITWKYYTATPGSIWTAPNAIQHMCKPNNAPPNGTVCLGNDWKNVSIPSSNIINDISNGELPEVSWVIPNGQESDHASSNTGLGPSWVASVVNAIGNSGYWSDTAIFITWDDWGGWYDHVAPPSIKNSYEYGFRVPLIVVSPYAKQAYISHVTHDFGSILKFIEETYGLPSLGYADKPADDLSDCFNFRQRARAYKNVSTKVSASYFVNSKEAPTDPDDD